MTRTLRGNGLARWALPRVPLMLFTALAPVSAKSMAAQVPASPVVTETTLARPGELDVRYAISFPDGYRGSADDPRPLVLALHPGGRAEYYGSSFMQGLVEPALRSWRAVIVAPDVPDRSWATPRSEAVLLALVEHVLARHAIDRERVLVTGFSLGGRGAWHMAAPHPEIFTGAVVMAGSPSAEDVRLLSTPIYLVHSPDDEVVAFGPVEEAYLALAAGAHPAEMTLLPGVGHFMMGAYAPALRSAGSWTLARWDEGLR